MEFKPNKTEELLALLKNTQPQSVASPLSLYDLMEARSKQLSPDPVISKLQKFGRGVQGLLEPETPLDYLGMAIPATKAVKGVVNLNKIYHGSPNKNLSSINIAKSERSEGFMPHVSGTDSYDLARAFTKGEFGDKPMGKVYVSEGNFKLIDYTTDEGKKLFDSLGSTDLERAVNAKKMGFDGRQINHYEDWKQPFYPEVDFSKIKNAKEIQLFKDLKVKPT
jgi:hypothetical protein